MLLAGAAGLTYRIAGGAEPPLPPAASGPATDAPPNHCRTGDLRVTLTGDAPASLRLLFENVSGRSCTLSGYPGLSWITGASATPAAGVVHRDGGALATFTLGPGGIAHAQLQFGVPADAGPVCQPAPVAGLWVTPPDETTAVFVPHTTHACTARAVGGGVLWPLAPGG